ncbi:MAG: thiamine-phosphate kinase [Thiohalomonadales bacterium]|nr:thiamine-phosphate kinase [Thiohalomonadales bacterium]
MSIPEFELIQRFFTRQIENRPDIVLGVGDDAALIATPADKHLVVAIDTLVEGVHFPPATSPYDIGWKALAVNLSDLAAMGAEPAWFTLALTLPESSESWLTEFSQGLFDLANRYDLPLIGGDTTRGPLTVTVQIGGTVPAGQALLRVGAMPGDGIFVSGTLGDATLALQIMAGEAEYPDLLTRLNRPSPRIAEGCALRGIASCAIDISDGLLADLGHILTASNCGAEIFQQRLPFSASAQQFLAQDPELWRSLISGGDDYELCFCVPPQQLERLRQIALQHNFHFTEIGRVVAGRELRCLDATGKPATIPLHGYRHFAEGNE